MQAHPNQAASTDQSQPWKKQKTVPTPVPSEIPSVPEEHKEYAHVLGANPFAVETSDGFCAHRRNMQPLAHLKKRALGIAHAVWWTTLSQNSLHSLLEEKKGKDHAV